MTSRGTRKPRLYGIIRSDRRRTKEQLVENYLPWAHGIAKGFMAKHYLPGESAEVLLEELKSAANIGLFKAAKSYKPGKWGSGAPNFQTRAKRYVEIALEGGLSQYRKEVMGLPPETKEAYALLEIDRIHNLPERRSPNERERLTLIRDTIKKVLAKSKNFASFEERSKKMYLMRTGLLDGDTHTAREVAKVFGATYQQVLKLEKRINNKLSREPEIKALKQSNTFLEK